MKVNLSAPIPARRMDELEVRRHSFLTLEQYGGKRPTSGPSRFITRNVRRYTSNRRLSASFPHHESKPDPLAVNLATVPSKIYRHFTVSVIFVIITTAFMFIGPCIILIVE